MRMWGDTGTGEILAIWRHFWRAIAMGFMKCVEYITGWGCQPWFLPLLCFWKTARRVAYRWRRTTPHSIYLTTDIDHVVDRHT
jgi:hypothetical protein